MTLCAFDPYGHPRPNTATVAVTITGSGVVPDEVPTCDEHVHDWIDEVAATAHPLGSRSAARPAGHREDDDQEIES